MRAEVIIPTVGGERGALMSALAGQTVRPWRVVVSVDGEGAEAPDVSALDRAGIGAVVVRGARGGPAAARNRALAGFSGDFALFLNDDVVPDARCVERHAAAQERWGRGALVVGAAGWCFGREPRVIDRVVAETSMVFFYDRMVGADAGRDWGYRHAWTLNLSAPAALVGRFDERLTRPMFDDLEWAWRATRGGVAVRYEGGARVEHRHRPVYTAAALVRREAMLGYEAYALRAASPGCYTATFGEGAPGFAREVDVDAGRRAYSAFSSLAEDAGAGVDVGAVFEGCGAWRCLARGAGWRAAERGQGFEAAAGSALSSLSA